jgi:hypothetical protein
MKPEAPGLVARDAAGLAVSHDGIEWQVIERRCKQEHQAIKNRDKPQAAHACCSQSFEK